MGDGEEGRGGLGNLMKESRKGGETVIGLEEMINKDKISKILAFQFKGGFQRRLFRSPPLSLLCHGIIIYQTTVL